MFPLIGSLLISVAGHLLGKVAGKALDSNAKPDAAAAQHSFSTTLSQETQRFAQAPGSTAVDMPTGPGLPPANGNFGALRSLGADRIEAP